MDAEKLRVTSSSVPLQMTGAAAVSAAVSEDGSKLFVSTGGDSIVVVDTASLSIASTWTAPATVSDLHLSASGSRLYLAAADGVDVLDPSTGAMLGTIPVPAQSIDFAGSPG